LESSGLHDKLLVGTPSKLTSDKNTRRLVNRVRNWNFLNLITKVVRHNLSKVFEGFDLLLTSSLLLVGFFELKTFFQDTDEFLALEFLQLSDS
jgi:hypothetical protein